MARHIWQRPTWPSFRWDANRLLPVLTEARFRQGRFLGMMRNVGIDVGQWRTDHHGTMQVVSQPYSPRARVHFEAPSAARVAEDMATFLAWFNDARGDTGMDPLIRAGIAHLWFVTIHPMDDGNGRMARAIADLAVARTENSGQRFYSMSSQIAVNRGRYYEILEETQKGDLDLTGWLSWFSRCYTDAIAAAEATADRVIAKARFWHAHAPHPFSDRQRKVLGKLLDGFEGAITTRKWMAICGCSADTAQRDITDLVGRGVLEKNPGGSRNTSYRFVWPG
ncbi:Fic family protein [Magnetospirillum sp. UT-4]|uniref:Fic family protein n=1 Tax=Magnetospirillum sp. UT-4 TaxID=2681467 RepID=UPI00137E483C